MYKRQVYVRLPDVEAAIHRKPQQKKLHRLKMRPGMQQLLKQKKLQRKRQTPQRVRMQTKWQQTM